MRLVECRREVGDGGAATGRLGPRLVAVVGILALGASGSAAVAAARPKPGFSLQVSPTRLVVPAGGVSAVQHFEVTNRGTLSFVVTVEKADFVADERGTLRFDRHAPYAAAAWVGVRPGRFRVEAGQTRRVAVRIAVPAAPEPGDHHLAVIFRVPATTTRTNIRVNRAIAAPVLIAVPGPVDRTVEIDGVRAPEFVTGGPVPISTRIRDVGTVHRDFRGRGRLHVRVGGDDLTFPDFTVLRGSVREVATRWNPPLMCVCHATVSVPAGDGTRRTATTRILVFPVHLLAVALGLAALLALLVWYARRRYRAKVLAAAAALNATEDGTDA
ncbi:hypothetical protein ABZU32_17660 [Sphaerisporangium sp. NPDC005288]|uniref:hypothetical protein n=1 Tax=Sphaerisporangium sp. NPDC005288 TaxID=3155114 RepID=UPI0033B8969E